MAPAPPHERGCEDDGQLAAGGSFQGGISRAQAHSVRSADPGHVRPDRAAGAGRWHRPPPTNGVAKTTDNPPQVAHSKEALAVRKLILSALLTLAMFALTALPALADGTAPPPRTGLRRRRTTRRRWLIPRRH